MFFFFYSLNLQQFLPHTTLATAQNPHLPLRLATDLTLHLPPMGIKKPTFWVGRFWGWVGRWSVGGRSFGAVFLLFGCVLGVFGFAFVVFGCGVLFFGSLLGLFSLFCVFSCILSNRQKLANYGQIWGLNLHNKKTPPTGSAGVKNLQ